MLWTGICFVLLVLLFLSGMKIAAMYRALGEIEKDLDTILNEETNMEVPVSIQDRHMRAYVTKLNRQLARLRDERHRYKAGDRELQNAVTNIAHDIRTPLTAISGYVELLEKEEKSEKVNTYLSYIKNRTNHLKALTEELFLYTVCHSEDDLELTECDICAFLEQTLLEYYGALKKKNIEPVIHFPENKVIRKVNAAALARVYANIISNAIKYSAGDFMVCVSEEGRICFTNSSEVLDEIQVGRMFDRFYTVETAHPSTGLGLSIARDMVEKMNGRIDAEFQEGRLTISIVFQ